MPILFDQGTPVPLREFLNPHQVETAFERGWSTLSNGELLAVGEQEGFEVFVMTELGAFAISKTSVEGTSPSSCFHPPVGLGFKRLLRQSNKPSIPLCRGVSRKWIFHRIS